MTPWRLRRTPRETVGAMIARGNLDIQIDKDVDIEILDFEET